MVKIILQSNNHHPYNFTSIFKANRPLKMVTYNMLKGMRNCARGNIGLEVAHIFAKGNLRLWKEFVSYVSTIEQILTSASSHFYCLQVSAFLVLVKVNSPFLRSAKTYMMRALRSHFASGTSALARHKAARIRSTLIHLLLHGNYPSRHMRNSYVLHEGRR